jgi:hypothetical protein
MSLSQQGGLACVAIEACHNLRAQCSQTPRCWNAYATAAVASCCTAATAPLKELAAVGQARQYYSHPLPYDTQTSQTWLKVQSTSFIHAGDCRMPLGPTAKHQRRGYGSNTPPLPATLTKAPPPPKRKMRCSLKELAQQLMV